MILQFLKTYSLFIVIVFLMITSSVCNAQISLNKFKDFTHYTKDSGLPSTYINAISEDKYGFIWLATQNGVSRFDGSDFTNFQYYEDEKKTYKIGNISTLVIDESGEKLWIGGGKGIFCTSIKDINFKKIEQVFPSINISIKRTDNILLERQNILWAANFGEGLSRIDLKGFDHKKFLFVNETQQENRKLNTIQCMINDPNDNTILWIGTLAGLIRFNTITKKYSVFVYNNIIEFDQNKIRNIHASKDEIFLGTWNKGLIVFNKKQKKFKEPFKKFIPNSHTLILDMYLENKKNLWITTGQGLICYDTQLKSIKESYNHNMAKGLMRGVSFIDSRGIIWLSTGKGLFKYNPRKSLNKFIKLETRNKLQNKMHVREIIVTNRFYYVLGFGGTGLYKINKNNYAVEIIDIPKTKHYGGNKIDLMDMVKMDNGNLLIISDSDIIIFNTKTQKSYLSSLQVNHPNPALQNIIKDKNNKFWIGGREGGLFCLDFKSKTIINYKEQFNVFRDGNHRWINNMYLDSKNKLWMAKGSSSVMNLNTESLYLLNPKDSIKSFHDVGGFQEDSKGRIWMAGYENGLGFTNFNDFNKGISPKIDGYFSNIYARNDSLLWTVGKNLGLLNVNSFVHKEIKLSYYDKKIKFTGPIVKNKKNEFIIGCDNGVYLYNTVKQKIDNKLPKVYIRKILGNGKTLYEGSSLTGKNLKFNANINNLIIKISSLEFYQPNQTSYKYKLYNQWIDLGKSKEINLTNLDHGKYSFQLKAYNALGLCNEVPIEYNLIILTPWYKTFWAYLFYVLLIGAIIYFLFRFNFKRKLAVAENKKTVELNINKTRFFTNISHEFRTPLTLIKGLIGQLEQHPENRLSKSNVKMIKRNTNKLLSLVNQLLDLSKLESGKLKLNLSEEDVYKRLRTTASSFSSHADQRNIDYQIIIPKNKSLWASFDGENLDKIIYNLLSNAFKFTDDVETIRISVTFVKEQLRIQVIDTGCGIPEDRIPFVFNRFFQVDGSYTKEKTGTGIGLSLTKELVELMNGSIHVESEFNKGSLFSVRIPLNEIKKITNKNEKKVTENKILEKNSSPKKINKNLPTVLIIEDHQDMRDFIKQQLENEYNIIEASNGQIGLEEAIKNIPDLILSDLMMPKLDGISLCKQLKTNINTSHIPIILLTAKTGVKNKIEGLETGADDYLTKPFSVKELHARIKNLITQRKKLRELYSKKDIINPKEVTVTSLDEQFLNKIIDLLENEFSNSGFSIPQMGKELAMSNAQLHRKIKALTSQSPGELLRNFRLKRAAQILKQNGASVAEVTYDVGFSNLSYFSKCFKELYGMSPSAYNKENN